MRARSSRRWLAIGALFLAAVAVAAPGCVRHVEAGPSVAAAPRTAPSPAAEPPRVPAGWFAFQPAPDPFGAAALDLRSLNETFAGEGGFIQARGDTFVHQRTGLPVRFWAVNIGHGMLDSDGAVLDRLARRLAKLGVNMVRLHGPLWRGDDVTRVDLTKLAKVHRLAAALKQQGIYLALSTYFPVWLQPKDLRGLEGYDGTLNTFAVPFFNHAFQDLQKSWWRQSLTAKNPYTGLTLLEDPALAFVEIQNEDSLFFWTFSPYSGIPAPQMEIVEKLFGQWLAAKDGSVENAFERWRGNGMYGRWSTPGIRGDVARAGRAGILPLSEILRRHDARARDTATFLAQLQRGYYDQMRSFLKDELGFKGAVSGSNWITADDAVLGPLDKWSNAGCDFMDRHGYYATPHEGERAGYLLSKGDRYADGSALLFETGKGRETSFGLPLMDLAYNGKPSTISEISWLPPNRFRGEMTVLSAAYGALQGSDAFFFFADDDPGWAEQLSKFTIADPAVMGEFPATALMFRRGLVRTADVAVRVQTKPSDLFALRGIPVAPPPNLDQLRKSDLVATPPGTPGPAGGAGAVDPLAFLVGRVQVDVSDQGGPSSTLHLSDFIDRQKKRVRSSTGELTWDYGRGLATVNAPAAQGATGFLSKAGTIALGDLSITSSLDYGSVLAVSLDERPLASSRRILLQVMSEDSNAGWAAPGTGLRPLLDPGGAPIVVKDLTGTVSFTRGDAASLSVVPLDENGYPLAPDARSVGANALKLRPTTFYYVIEKDRRRELH